MRKNLVGLTNGIAVGLPERQRQLLASLLRVKLGRGLRLTGLAWQGSIPCACVGFGALCVAVVSRMLTSNLLSREVKEGAMATKRSEVRSAFAVSLLDAVSGTGAGCAAGALLT